MQNDQTTIKSVSATAIGTFEVFASLSTEKRHTVASLMRIREYSSGSYVIPSAQDNKDVYFIISGKVRACAFSNNGKQIYFEDLSAGMMFGELAAIDNGERSNDCISVQNSLLAVLSQKHFLELLDTHPEINEALLKRLATMVRRNLQRVYELSSFSVNQRVRFELLRLASTAKREDSTIIIDNPPSHADFAARISTHREGVTRELNSLESAGIITRRTGKQYVIHDISKLAELASS